MILVFLNINLACLKGPIKKKVEAREAILPKVNINPNFTADAFVINKMIAIKSNTNPRQKQIIKPQNDILLVMKDMLNLLLKHFGLFLMKVNYFRPYFFFFIIYI